MAADLRLFIDEEMTHPVEGVSLADSIEVEGEIGGDPVQIFGVNSGDTILRSLSIGLNGEGAAFVQLARDENGEPGVWADNAQSINAENLLLPGGRFSFWVRGAFSLEDREGNYPFNFVVRGMSGS